VSADSAAVEMRLNSDACAGLFVSKSKTRCFVVAAITSLKAMRAVGFVNSASAMPAGRFVAAKEIWIDIAASDAIRVMMDLRVE